MTIRFTNLALLVGALCFALSAPSCDKWENETVETTDQGIRTPDPVYRFKRGGKNSVDMQECSLLKEAVDLTYRYLHEANFTTQGLYDLARGYYENGERGEKGELLLQIDTRSLKAKEAALKSAYEKLRIKTEGLRQTEKSFYGKTVCIDKRNTAAFTRFQAFSYQKELLEKRYALAEKTRKEALRMPSDAITGAKLRELEYEADIQLLNLETYKSSFIKEISAEYAQCVVELEDLKSRAEQVRQSIKNSSVFAPIAGRVQEISSLNKNDYLFADQKILNIIPDDGRTYKAELKIPAKMSGKLEKGMRVKLRFPAFPFYEFGGAEGTVVSIDPDATADVSGMLYFTVSADIDKAFLEDRKKRRYPVKSGLETEARIILRERTILWYILKQFDLVW